MLEKFNKYYERLEESSHIAAFLNCIMLPKLPKRKIWLALWNSAKIKNVMNNMWQIGFHGGCGNMYGIDFHVWNVWIYNWCKSIPVWIKIHTGMDYPYLVIK